MSGDPLEEYPRQVARTRGFTLGAPRSFTVAPDGSRVVFLRSMAGDDPVSCLWVLDPETGEERCVFDPRQHGLGEEGELSEAERARRERVRERSSGVTAYAADHEVRRVVFTVSGRPFVADLVEDWVDELTVPGTVDDPRLDPSGQRVAYVVDGALHVRALDGGNRVPAADDAPAPRAIRYPQAGTEDAVVTLFVFDVATGARFEIAWDREAFPYLARVLWDEGGPLTLLVQSRDQRRVQLLEADETTGATGVVAELEDREWFDLFEDAPLRMDDGRIVMVVAD